MRRVVITGLGLITPLGIGTAATWQGLIEGRSALAPLPSLDAATWRTRLAGEVKGFDARSFVKNRRSLRLMMRSDQFAFAAASLALADAGLAPPQLDPDRTGIFLGSNKDVCDPDHFREPALAARDENGQVDPARFARLAYEKVYPLVFVEGLPASSLFFLSEEYHLQGVNGFFIGTADASAVAIGRAFRAIRRGEADLTLAGGCDAPLTWLHLSKLEALTVMTSRNDLGAAAYCPYDRRRSGCLLGEGGALLVLEEYAAARRRGARIYAEIVGFGSGNDAYSIVAPHPEGRGLQIAIQAALREAASSPSAVDVVMTHGSGTRDGDPSEVAALRAAFAASPAPPRASCTKPATGHLVAAAGALNTAITALTVYHQIVPPLLHLEDVEPQCRWNWIGSEACPLPIVTALALARGLEGHNVALVVKASPQE